MLIERFGVWLLDLPLREAFAAAHGTTSSRELAVVRVETDVGHGWGECSALPEPTYTAEYAAGAYDVLIERLSPLLLGQRLIAPDALDLSAVGGHPMAVAAVEMALLDVDCRARSYSLAEHLGTTRRSVPTGAAIGLDTVEGVARRAADLAEQGFGRAKLKIQPGHDRAVVAAVQAVAPSLEVQVDANGSYGPGDVALLTELAAAGVTAIEQPFAVDDVDSAAALVAAVSVPVVADEAVTTAADLERLHSLGALSGVSIKPARVGGIRSAVQLLDRCVAAGLPATAGGMVESALGRHALAAVAALDGFTLTGDVSPAGRWLAADPWPDLTLTADGVRVPTSPGIAPDPDLDVLAAHTIRAATVS
ncbi:MAG: o-succinylbenzoate synthase [Acidimicrobiales bacterium]